MRNGVSRTSAALLVTLLLPATAFAELRRVEIAVAGLDCASCAGAMSAALKKLDGVESVDISAEKGTVDIKLAPGNALSVPRIRREIRSRGNEPREAQVTARGRFRDRDGTPVLDLLNGVSMELDGAPEKARTETVEVTGVSTERTRDAERLKIAHIKSLPE